MDYPIAPKKSKDKAIFDTHSKKSKGSSAFDEQKVKNIAIEYRFKLIFPNPGPTSGPRTTV